MRREAVQLQLRLPPDVKAWLAAEAERNGCSQNSEVIRALRLAMSRTTELQPPP